jgi:hypothetical protein
VVKAVVLIVTVVVLVYVPPALLIPMLLTVVQRLFLNTAVRIQVIFGVRFLVKLQYVKRKQLKHVVVLGFLMLMQMPNAVITIVTEGPALFQLIVLLLQELLIHVMPQDNVSMGFVIVDITQHLLVLATQTVLLEQILGILLNVNSQKAIFTVMLVV